MSWLFTQFMLTNQVQIAYSQTEGYLPVTTKAYGSTEYQDYLLREGEDNDLYYDIKIKSARLLLDNIDNTFTTPVFNGSASLRNAAGQMIENTAMSAKRGERIDEYYVRDLYSDVTSLYKLNQLTADGMKKDFGALPGGSVALIIEISAIWLGIGGYIGYEIYKKRKTDKNSNKRV